MSLLFGMLTALLAVACFYYSPVSAVVGGHDTSIEKFPYQVSVEIDGEHHCGGSIINEEWILTSNACLKKLPEKYVYTVRVGSSERESGGIVHNVTNVIPHPDFKQDGKASVADAALIQLKEKIDLSGNTATAVKLPPSLAEDPDWSHELIVTGWGAKAADDTSYADVLQAVRIPAVPRTVCELVHAKETFSLVMLCAGVSGKDWCDRDRGAPLVVEGSLVQVGIASWSSVPECGLPGFPSVFTKVGARSIRRWIETETGE